MSERGPCAHCGRICGDFDGGFAAVSDADASIVQVCHPNVIGRPDCYRLITVYHEKLGARLPGRAAG
jgi:hypothetical protein